MAPGNTRQAKLVAKGKNEHEISEDEPSGDEEGQGEFALSDKQMNAVSFLVKSAVSAAVAQMLPLTQRVANSQDAMGGASSSASAQGSSGASSENNNRTSAEDSTLEEGEVHDEVLDEYEKSLVALLGDNKVTGPVISDQIGRILERCLGSPLDEKIVKAKRDAHPRPDTRDAHPRPQKSQSP